MADSSVVVSEVDGITVASIHGVCDATTASDIGGTLARAAERDELIVSLRDCSYIDIDLIAVLTRLYRRLGQRFCVVDDLRPAVERTGMHRVFHIERNIDDAVRWMKSQTAQREAGSP
jgi:anti-anti-sigma regulatory factor